MKWTDWKHFPWFTRAGWTLELMPLFGIGKNYAVALVRRKRIQKESDHAHT